MFSQFISLGSHCRVAASMAKYGFRSWSGPFDWLITYNLEWVLYFIENDFLDFLQIENLESHQGKETQFFDKRSGFYFLHDQEYPFRTRYNELKLKYQRRINRFIEEIYGGVTCFLRLVTRADELKYISENAQYINNVIKKSNWKNEIVFLVDDRLPVPASLQFQYFVIHISKENSQEALRGCFDNADEFLKWCASNYNSLSLMENLIFSYKERDYLSKEQCFFTTQKRYYMLTKLVDFNFDNSCLPDQIIIYGAGNVGKAFYNKIKDKCDIKYFIDEKYTAIGNIDGILCKNLKDIDYDEHWSFIVTPTYDYEKICKDIKECYGNAKVISLDDILEETM